MTEYTSGGFTATTCGDLSQAAQISNARLAASLARSAVRILEHIEAGHSPESRIDSVTWRLADALYRLRQYGDGDMPGIDCYTGLGARLDARREK